MPEILKMRGAVPATDYALEVYNGLDAMLTREICTKQLENLRKDTSRDAVRYAEYLQRANAIAFEMMVNGIRFNNFAREDALGEIEKELGKITQDIADYCAIVKIPVFNPMSNEQVYQALRASGIAENALTQKIKGVLKISVARSVLEKLKTDSRAEYIVNFCLQYRDLKKFASFIQMRTNDGEFVSCSFSVGTTTTGRWSSSANPLGLGTNFQNIPDRARHVFIARTGFKFGQMDQAQAESRLVAIMALRDGNDESYLNACLSGDLHTAVTRMCWKNFDWGENMKANAIIAKQIAYRDLSYRDMAKRLGHGSNYGGMASTLAAVTKTETGIVVNFQQKYFAAFPGIKRWHERVREKLADDGVFIDVFGGQRIFSGDRNSDNVFREALAHEPQGTIAKSINYALLRFRQKYPPSTGVRFLAQIHDAVLFEYPQEDRFEVEELPKIAKAFTVELGYKDYRAKIPVELSVGWNWRKNSGSKDNPYGMRVIAEGECDGRNAEWREEFHFTKG